MVGLIQVNKKTQLLITDKHDLKEWLWRKELKIKGLSTTTSTMHTEVEPAATTDSLSLLF